MDADTEQKYKQAFLRAAESSAAKEPATSGEWGKVLSKRDILLHLADHPGDTYYCGGLVGLSGSRDIVETLAQHYP